MYEVNRKRPMYCKWDLHVWNKSKATYILEGCPKDLKRNIYIYEVNQKRPTYSKNVQETDKRDVYIYGVYQKRPVKETYERDVRIWSERTILRGVFQVHPHKHTHRYTHTHTNTGTHTHTHLQVHTHTHTHTHTKCTDTHTHTLTHTHHRSLSHVCV